MPRPKYQILTEQMFYSLLCLHEEKSAPELMELVPQLTNGRVTCVGGTLYTILRQFIRSRIVVITRTEGQRRFYLITDTGRELFRNEVDRIREQLAIMEDYQAERGFGLGSAAGSTSQQDFPSF